MARVPHSSTAPPPPAAACRLCGPRKAHEGGQGSRTRSRVSSRLLERGTLVHPCPPQRSPKETDPLIARKLFLKAPSISQCCASAGPWAPALAPGGRDGRIRCQVSARSPRPRIPDHPPKELSSTFHTCRLRGPHPQTPATSPSPCWRSRWSYHGSSSISNSSTRLSASMLPGTSGGSGLCRRRAASAAAPGCPPAPPPSARAALGRDAPAPPQLPPPPPPRVRLAPPNGQRPSERTPGGARSRLLKPAARPNVALWQSPPRPGRRFKPGRRLDQLRRGPRQSDSDFGQ